MRTKRTKKKCPACGGVNLRPESPYCSRVCAQRASRGSPDAGRECERCGGYMTISYRADARYCSASCRVAAYRARARQGEAS